jgi:hypothetical protein
VVQDSVHYPIIGDRGVVAKTRKKVGELKSDIDVIRRVLTPSFRKPRSSYPKNEPFSQEMHLKILFLGRGLKLSNSITRL